jgi:hypothetical protein
MFNVFNLPTKTGQVFFDQTNALFFYIKQHILKFN